MHEPQLNVPPHPSATDPHVLPSDVHVAGMQTLHTLFVQVPAAHAPHVSVPPHPSPNDPQLPGMDAHVAGVQTLHTLASHDPAHAPHASVPPHPSGIDPQLAPSSAHVSFEQPQTLAVAPPPHVAGAVHAPQSRR